MEEDAKAEGYFDYRTDEIPNVQQSFHVEYWISKCGYYMYRFTGLKAKRISKKEYESAYKYRYDL